MGCKPAQIPSPWIQTCMPYSCITISVNFVQLYHSTWKSKALQSTSSSLACYGADLFFCDFANKWRYHVPHSPEDSRHMHNKYLQNLLLKIYSHGAFIVPAFLQLCDILFTILFQMDIQLPWKEDRAQRQICASTAEVFVHECLQLAQTSALQLRVA
jgi:hypothetical protein